ncbi:NUDIX domain-containing protein [Burkholderia pseudomallei]|uniref:NUDIX domain-containing protein n=1 Tax=Burkholderia pseudomallei TaxID=28450 RepID=UPI001F340D6A|nr:NUDIX domain-containing protein [Burkholderia pseudomallei]
MPLVARTLSRGSPPGGIIRCGEAPLDAARRALEEQTRLAGLELMYFFSCRRARETPSRVRRQRAARHARVPEPRGRPRPPVVCRRARARACACL